MDYVRPPSGSSPEARFARFMHEAVTRQSNLVHVTGHRVSNTSQGKVFIPSSGGRRRNAVAATQFKLRNVEDDYLIGRTWDGTNLGADDVFIAKPPELRCSVTSETIYGDLHSYTYAPDADEPFMDFGTAVTGQTYNEWGEEPSDYANGTPPGPLFQKRLNVVRSVVIDGVTENQRVIPVWRKGMIIYGAPFDDGGKTPGGDAIEFILTGTARMWARI